MKTNYTVQAAGGQYWVVITFCENEKQFAGGSLFIELGAPLC